ncbi:MAG: hypothetical protein IPO46_09550 [Chitinophagaceae bacterium]|nr:hypothetical protein [Chitinophagaceae bacterium]MBK7088431.1 hypothetical protein [Chitinophagaceae bacterium]MBK7345460.1 hypothetical protein [Chitinophagaceae bacterium]MBK8775785.1 hypothetical protein [Chitinophagaceae bacterium]MBK8930171.1 hypothetical protein [Chitinophagaceae bacterium]
MMSKQSPKLRTVNKSVAAFPLNEFPKDFPFLLGKELIYLLASKGKPELEGSDWESIFASCIGADWKPSNVGLDDVVMGNTAWGAKTVKATKPSSQKKVRLISGRNSPIYSFGERIDTKANPNTIGSLILDIWNERVSAVREKFKHLRTVVLVKSGDLSEVVVFEFETIRYDNELFTWEWNKNKNLVGREKKTGEHRFTWQPHGSQFTIIEDVPEKSLVINIKQPKTLDKEQILKALGFDKSWITVTHKNG